MVNLSVKLHGWVIKTPFGIFEVHRESILTIFNSGFIQEERTRVNLWLIVH